MSLYIKLCTEFASFIKQCTDTFFIILVFLCFYNLPEGRVNIQ
ncbi:hypothetical protein HMPREF0080_00805 [Anaeroglobus geminatus F0357]|uniref:Uncharacterized protein n=1 Tax=Anaeroglobus geminatus F0357 TaxID=861450 RepID=G9YGN8_9FIRM|nr:hypothetical protein HMPREF0080_00805 [Anaeroglobus geminatus F0357]